MPTITFEKLDQKNQKTVYSWLKEAHVQEFWDNTPEHKEDMLNFIDGRRVPSSYCDGKYTYWLASINTEPYGLIMSIQETEEEDIGELKISCLSKTGHTYGLDFMIGNTKFLGRGYGALTLIAFLEFFRENIDPSADTFLIDPQVNNTRARRVYEKAGFTHVGEFILPEGYSGSGLKHDLLIKNYT